MMPLTQRQNATFNKQFIQNSYHDKIKGHTL